MRQLVFYCLLGGVWSGLISPVFGQNEKASLQGLVLDGATRQPIIDARIEAQSTRGAVAKARTVAPDGSFILKLNSREVYRVQVEARGYTISVEQIDFSDARVVSRVGKMIYLSRSVGTPARTAPVATVPPPTAPKKETVVSAPAPKASSAPPPPTTPVAGPSLTATNGRSALDPVFFVQSTSDILPESRESLDLLVRFLIANPNTIVELGGHTDNQGDFDQNVVLSRQRAELVKNYVLSKGVKPGQVRTRGYGGTRPAATNNYEKTRPMNRRVEITVIQE